MLDRGLLDMKTSQNMVRDPDRLTALDSYRDMAIIMVIFATACGMKMLQYPTPNVEV